MLTTIVATVIVIGIIVFIHELGHFTAAKLSGVRVERFSLGLGPKLVGIPWGETEYVISAIPFGGYVKMEGEIAEDDEAGAPVEHGERSFLGKSKRTRAFIIAAGPVMNFLLAIIIYVILIAGTGVAVFTTREIGVVEEGTPAWDAGLRVGDVVETVDGVEIENWDNLLDVLEKSLGNQVTLAVERNRMSERLSVDLRAVTDLRDVGIDMYIPPVADSVSSGSPAEQAGIRSGDRITDVGGRAVRTWQDLARVVEPASGEDLEIKWARNGEVFVSTIRPEDFGGVGKIGIMNDYVGEYELQPVGLLAAMERGVNTAAWMSVQIFKIPRLLRAGVPFREVVGGPIRIGQLAGETLRRGPGTFFAFIAALSAQLSLVNLLPIPVLDGGHLFIFGVEAVARRPISMRQRIIAQQIGLALLIAIMLVFTMSDVSKLLGW